MLFCYRPTAIGTIGSDTWRGSEILSLAEPAEMI